MFCCASCLAKAKKPHNFCLLKFNSDSKAQNVAAALISEEQLFLLKQIFCLCLKRPREKICRTVEELLAISCNMLFIGELPSKTETVCLPVLRSLSHVLVTFFPFHNYLIMKVLQKDLNHFNPS